MTFAKAYREEITFVYYCLNVLLTSAIFFVGTIYLRRIDRRDQQRRDWREFAETIRGQYSTLKDKQVLSWVSETNKTFENVLICPGITGLDVLRYMLNDSYFASRSSRESALYKLREDLNSIFQPLSTCASFISWGPVPRNIRAELTELVTDLGQVTLPFFKGDQCQTVLKCLKHFRRDGKIKTEKMLRDIDLTIETSVPYIKCLSFGLHQRSIHYSKIDKFEFDSVLDPAVNFLKAIQDDLQNEKYLSDFAREFHEHLSNLQDFDLVNSDDERLVVMKVLHQIRVYMHSSLKKGAIDEEVRRDIELLSEIYERVTSFKPDEEIIRITCERFIQDLSNLKENSHHSSPRFKEELMKLYQTFINLSNNGVSSLPPTLTARCSGMRGTNNYQRESYV